ncbi:hypothetical protein TSUD_274930 [Trifolium subterraneum]|uniref:Uncharacterized protein n=1 Tax=Trifolium subterraneum TaxID=3900 RepID=A0A2Z6MVB1_TRISU|nr:hypothetical protein TSUD_274930 [Trifolium subterraneum]
MSVVSLVSSSPALNLIEKGKLWYNSIEKITASAIEGWVLSAPDENIHLPAPNKFIPTDLSLKVVLGKVWLWFWIVRHRSCQVSYGSELGNRGPIFDMDLSDFMDGDKPISYKQAREYFAQDPAQNPPPSAPPDQFPLSSVHLCHAVLVVMGINENDLNPSGSRDWSYFSITLRFFEVISLKSLLATIVAKTTKDAGVFLPYVPNLRLTLWPSADSAREGIMRSQTLFLFLSAALSQAMRILGSTLLEPKLPLSWVEKVVYAWKDGWGAPCLKDANLSLDKLRKGYVEFLF